MVPPKPRQRNTRTRDGRIIQGRASVRHLFENREVIDAIEDESFEAAYHVCSRVLQEDWLAGDAIELCDMLGLQELWDEIALKKELIP
jgi:hypothetical protein